MTADELELELVGDLMKFEWGDVVETPFEEVEDVPVDALSFSIHLPRLDGIEIDNDLVHAIAKYLIETEELYDTEKDTLLMIARFTYGFVQDQT